METAAWEAAQPAQQPGTAKEKYTRPPHPRPTTAAPARPTISSPGRGAAFKKFRDSIVWTQGVADSATAPQQALDDDILWTEGASDDSAPPSSVITSTSSSSLSCASSSDQPSADTTPSIPKVDSQPAADPLRQAANGAGHAADEPYRDRPNKQQLHPIHLRRPPDGLHGYTSARLEAVTPPSAQLPCVFDAASIQQDEVWADPAATGSAVCQRSPTPYTTVEPLPSISTKRCTAETIPKARTLHPAALPHCLHPPTFRELHPPHAAQARAHQQHLASDSAAYSSIDTVTGAAQPADDSSNEDDQEGCSLVFDDGGSRAALDSASDAREASMAAVSFNAAKSPDRDGGGKAKTFAAAAAGETAVKHGASLQPPATATADHVGAPHGCLLQLGSLRNFISRHCIGCVCCGTEPPGVAIRAPDAGNGAWHAGCSRARKRPTTARKRRHSELLECVLQVPLLQPRCDAFLCAQRKSASCLGNLLLHPSLHIRYHKLLC